MERHAAIVLLVEDDPDHADLCRRGLEGTGIDLVAAADLSSARVWLAGHAADLVIADMRLPDGSALELLEPGACAAPVVVMTSHGGEQQVVDAMKRGALDYVVKTAAMFRELPLIVERALRSAALLATKRRTEQQLRDSEQRFRELAQAIQEVFWLYEPATDAVGYVSPAWTQLFGGAPEDVHGPLALRLAVVAEEDRERVERTLREEAVTEPVRLEYRARGPAGELVVLERTYPLFCEQGRPWRVAGVITDITQRRRLEEVARRAQQLGALGDLVGGVAHELNNMLGTILYAAGALSDRVTADRESRELCELVANAATRNTELTQQLMAFARVGAHTVAPVDANRIAWDAITVLRRSLDRRALVVGDLRASPAVVRGDAMQLQTALLHLGLQMRDRTGALEVETDNVILDDTACASLPFDVVPGPYVRIAMYASGADAAELRARVFDPLSAEDASIHLGVGAVYGVIVAHRGALAVYGGVEGGAVIKIYLPLVRDDPSESKKVAPIAASTGQDVPRGSGAVLVADDEPLVRDALARVVANLGYKVTVARDGDEVLARLADAGPFAAVICELVLPGEHGPELVAEIRARAPGVPVIVSSGFVRERQLLALAPVGIAAYLQKPVRRADLAAVLAAATGNVTR